MAPPDICGFQAFPFHRTDSRFERLRNDTIAVTVAAPGRFSKVQRLVNRQLQYVWEPVDRWDSPQDAWDRGAGDCEEFALVKRAILIASGIPDEDLFLLLANDLARRQLHALLIARQGSKSYLLDVTGDIYPCEQARDFMPIAAYSGTGSWIYGRRA